jgi:oligosaccharide repeat unit polymerase
MNFRLVLSPIFIFALVIVVYSFFWSLPEYMYVSYILEPKFVNSKAFFYIILSFIMFISGYYLTPKIKFGPAIDESNKRTVLKIIIFFCFISILINVLVIIKFLSMISLNDLWLSITQGEVVKNGIYELYSKSVKGVSWLLVSGPVILGIGFWLKWKYYSRYNLLHLMLNLTLLINIIRPLLRGDRGSIIIIIISIIWLKLFYLYLDKKLDARKIFTLLFAVISISLVLFGLIQFSRSDEANIIGDMFGYFGGSFNRLAFQLDFDFPMNRSNGYYIFNFISMFPIINDIFPLERFISFLTSYIQPKDTFWLWLNAGLNPNFNVITAFGYTYTDFKWFGILFFFVYGGFSRIVINSLISKSVFGIALYGPLIFTLLELRGKLEITYYNFIANFFLIIIIIIIINLFNIKRIR